MACKTQISSRLHTSVDTLLSQKWLPKQISSASQPRHSQPPCPLPVPSSSRNSVCMYAMKPAGQPPVASAPGRIAACTFTAIPVLDLQRFHNPLQRQAFLDDLRHAAHAVGFFYVVGHGLPPDWEERALGAARTLFSLPPAAKAAFDYSHSASFRGYMAQGVENTNGKVDQREQFEYGLEFPPLPADICSVQPPYRRLHGPNQWPDEQACPGVRDALMEYIHNLRGVAETLLQALALAAGLPQGTFTDAPAGSAADSAASTRTSHSPPSATASEPNPPYMTVKVVRYPATEGADGFGVGPHSDSGLLTLLAQDDVGGLQALSGDGSWVAVAPLRGALVVNLGELLQRATQGYYVATVHQVINRPTAMPAPSSTTTNNNTSPASSAAPAPVSVSASASAQTTSAHISTSYTRERLSLPFFYNARLDQAIMPLPLPPDLPWQRPPPATDSATHGGRNRLLPVAGENVLKSFVRSHPQVVQRQHPDIWSQQQAQEQATAA